MNRTNCKTIWTAGAIVVAALLVSGNLSAANFYVSTNATVTYDGSSWQAAFTNIQDALNTVEADDTIHLAGHTFSLTNQLNWTTAGITVRGGYEALETDPAKLPGTNNPVLWPTVINRKSGAIRLIYISGANNSRIEHVTITGGNVVSADGGGLYIANSQGLVLSGCAIVGNRCVTSIRRGGGIYATGSDVVLTNCLVRGNVNNGDGAAAYNEGGGIWSNNKLKIQDSRILENYISRTHASSARGSAIHFAGTELNLVNVLIVANSTLTYDTGGVWVESGTATIRNCTIANNAGRGIRRNGGTVNLINTIVWGNGLNLAGSINASYSLIGNTDLGGNNLTGDPLFEYGYYLAAGSPAIEKGSDSAGALGLTAYTTRTDGAPYADSGDTVNLGFHYFPGSKFDLTWADVYVCATAGDDENDGLLETEPFRTLTKALATARDGTRIHVATGHYARAIGEVAGEVYPLTLKSLTGVRILGSGAAETVLNAQDAGRRIFTFTYAPQTVVSGLTITGASFGYGTAYHGGGLYIEASQRVMVSDCVISNNTVSGGDTFGGGLYALESDVTVSSCLVQSNRSTTAGGGTRKTRGGGLCSEFGRLTVLNSKILDNTCSLRGSGGGIWFSGLAANMRNVLISGNYASSGQYSDSYRGSGLWIDGGTVELGNCTVADNVEDGISRVSGTVNLLNSIVWNNVSDIVGTVNVSHSNVGTGGYGEVPDGDGNITADPLFTDPGDGDYRLQRGSPSIDRGLNQDWMIGATDLAGVRRIFQGRVDMGCYETVPPKGMLLMVE